MGRRGVLRVVATWAFLLAMLLVRPATAQAVGLDGVDISGWNTGINYAKLGDFVIIKATEYNPTTKTYTSYNDYQAKADAALKAGKLIGFYHFATNPSRGATIKQQAQGFIDAVSVKDASGNYKYFGRAVLCLDWEDTSYSSIESHVAWAKEWLDYVYEKTGVLPLIYTNKTCANSYNWSSVAKTYKLWGAMWLNKYSDKNGFIANPSYTEYGQWGAWGAKPTIYQYSATATLHNDKVYDVNKFYGTKQDWAELAYAGECVAGTYNAKTLLEDGAIYSFSPSIDTSTGLVVANVSNNAAMGSSTGRSYLSGYWRVQNHGDGTYSFVSLSGEKLLSTTNSPASGTNVNLSSASNRWQAIKCSNGALALAPVGNKALRLDVAGGKSNVAGTNVRVYKSNGTPAQRFFFTKAVGLNEAQSAGKVLDNGVYSVSTALNTNVFVEIKGGSTTKGANVQLHNSNNTMAQRFQLVYKGNGLYTIKSFKSGLSLDVKGGSSTKGANVQQYTGNTTLAQLWYLKKDGDKYAICSALSGLVLDCASGKTDNGTNIQLWTSNGSKAQRFALSKNATLASAMSSGKTLDEGTYRIALASDASTCVAADESTANGANVSAALRERSRTQKFDLVYVGNGLYTLKSDFALKTVDIKGSGLTSGANAQLWKGNSTLAQMWYPVKKGTGYQLLCAASGNALAVNGSNVCVMTPDASSPKQIFTLEAAPLIDDGAYEINSLLGSTLMLAAKDNNPAKGVNVQIETKAAGKPQQWKITAAGDGSYTIGLGDTNLVLEVQSGSTAKGGNIRLWTSNGTPAQRWTPIITAQGGLTFKNVKSGLVLDVAGGKKVAGTNIQQWTSNGSVAQGFMERAVDAIVTLSLEVPAGATEEEASDSTDQQAPDDAALEDSEQSTEEPDTALEIEDATPEAEVPEAAQATEDTVADDGVTQETDD